jgi:hypothetical protein
MLEVPRVLKAGRLLHVDIFLKKIIKKSVVDINLMEAPTP